MEGSKLAFILAMALVLPMAATAAASNHTQSQTYIAGGSGVSTTHSNSAGATTVGTLWFEIPEAFQAGTSTVDIFVRDVHTGNVAALYSFHDEEHRQGSVFGPAVSALESGSFCKTTLLDVPEDAILLRVVVNAPDSVREELSCLPGRGTVGSVDVIFNQ